MDPLHPTSGHSSSSSDLTGASHSGPKSRFNKKTVSKIDDRRSGPVANEGLRGPDAEPFTDSDSRRSRSVGSSETATSILTDYEADYFADSSNESITSNRMIRSPSEEFPAPASAEGARITIGNGVDEPASADGASITIKGGGSISKASIKSLAKRLWNWVVDFASNHKIAIGIALSVIFVFIMASPAGPIIMGGTVGAVILASLGMVATCGLVGALLVDMISKIPLFAQQQVPPPVNRQNQNPQTATQNQQPDQSPEPGSQLEPAQHSPEQGGLSAQPRVSATATPAGVQQKTGHIAESDGQFFLTPLEKMSGADEGLAAQPVKSSSGAGQAKPFSMAAFDSWLSENFARWSSRQNFAKFSKHMRNSDNDEALDADAALDHYLQELDQKLINLSVLANSPLHEPLSSEALQKFNLQQFTEVFESTLAMLDPTPEHCRFMMAQLLSVLPPEEFPWVSPDLWAPLLSIGEGRKSIEGFSRSEMAQVEASDFLRVSLLIMARYADKRQAQLANPGRDTAESGKFVAAGGAESSSDDGQSQDDSSVMTEITSAESDEKPFVFDEEAYVIDEQQQSILRRFKQLPGLEAFDTQLPRLTKNRVNFEAFFTNIITAVVQWDERSKTDNAEEKSGRTKEHRQMLVTNLLARGVFEAGFRMMRDTPEAIKIGTASGRKEFLGILFASPEVEKIFADADIEAKEAEQAIAREYLVGFIK